MAEQEPLPDPVLDNIVLKHFPRAGAGEEHQMKSTSELFAILDEHMPGRWSADILAQYLEDRAYERKLVGDELRWAVGSR